MIAPPAVNMRTPLLALAAATAALSAATPARAQQAAPSICVSGDSARADTPAAGRADVVIRAGVSIRELRFETRPQAGAAVLGCPPGTPVVRVVERRNLPERVEPGVTYRDVYVAVEIVGRLEAECVAALAGDPALAPAAGGPCAPAAGDSARAPPRP